MAELALQLPIFIASPSDVGEERDAAERVILRLAGEAARQRVLLQPVRWEKDALPGAGRPQELINKILRRSELIVVVFGGRLGSASTVDGAETGAQEEFRLGMDLVRTGRTDDVFPYFKKIPPGAPLSPEVASFREGLARSKRVFLWDYTSVDELETMIEGHLRRWLEKWLPVPGICQMTLSQVAAGTVADESLDENRLQFMTNRYDPRVDPEITRLLGREAVTLYQETGPAGARREFRFNSDEVAERRLREVLRSGASQAVLGGRWPLVSFVAEEWFYLYCAFGLLDAIAEGRLEAVSRRPYVNPVHQYLSALGRVERPRLVPTLIDWLCDATGATRSKPVARNFAAYVLGMIGAQEAEDVLAESAQNDRGQDVRLYCATSLGKLRSRRHLDVLIRLHGREPDASIRLMIGQAICRVCGIAEYEL
jgi:hypothetical protein